ncbi:hypothetical protein CO731_04875 [Aminobacter sp. MSH1]|uniref:hypothetical protein n=1 Tax=Aminobacter sp. MSH1 TaxID=374606 RepID=UPI000D3A0434|nr:hypothetical protein [Aminobacter sp. MSH1]AWC25380.1 hypothetical protein CO731_04875 [Aminobacter sp. MSH1]
MTDQPYCRACTHFNEANGEKRCGHPNTYFFDRIDGETRHPLIGEHVTSLCDIYNRFEPKGQ